MIDFRNFILDEDIKALFELKKVLTIDDEINIPFGKSKVDFIEKGNHHNKFFIKIDRNQFISLKATFHSQTTGDNIQLFRIDFGGKHYNPVKADGSVHPFIKKYENVSFDYNEPHIHLPVTGNYRQLAWAVPLESIDFSIKQMLTTNDYQEVLTILADVLNVESYIRFNPQKKAF